MGFETGLSGLNVNSQYLDSIGNNVSNSNVVGFKASSARFSDVYANSLAGGSQIGLGTQLMSVNQQFSQGSISATSNPLDMAINGNGFFRLAGSDGSPSYTRNGQFQPDKNGYIVNSAGQRLQGYAAQQISSTTGGVTTTTTLIDKARTQDILLPTADINASQTGTATLEANLDAGKAVPTGGAFNPANANTYNNVTSVNVYDSLGNSHSVSMYFARSGNAANTWDVYYTLDGSTANVSPASAPMTFNSSGVLVAPASGSLPVTLTLNSTIMNVASPQNIAIDVSKVTQFGGQGFGVTSTISDGYSSGRLTGFNISQDGILQGRYSNGETRTLGQVALASFRSPENLASIGNNQWQETVASGQAKVGVPGSGVLGALKSSSVEQANVDLTRELVNMIVAQRAYQANAQTIKTQDQILSTLVNLR